MTHTVGNLPKVVETFSALQSLLLSTEGTERVLAELAQLAAQAVEPPASVGITVSRNGQPFTVANSDGRAARVDETQYEVGEGPCLESLRTGAVVNVPDQRSDRRWGASEDVKQVETRLVTRSV